MSPGLTGDSNAPLLTQAAFGHPLEPLPFLGSSWFLPFVH